MVQTINLTLSLKSICFDRKMKLVMSTNQNHTNMSQTLGQPDSKLLTLPIVGRFSSSLKNSFKKYLRATQQFSILLFQSFA